MPISFIRKNSANDGDSRRSSVPVAPAVLDAITSDTESVVVAAPCPDGLARRADGEERRVEISVVAVLTDRRVLFVSDEACDEAGEVDAGELAYADVAGVRFEDGELALSTTAGVEWRVAPSAEGPDPDDPAVRHLRWIGRVRRRVEARGADVERAAAAIGDAAAAGDWEEAREVYEEARADLDATIGAVQRTEPVEDATLAPRLTALERTLEAAHAEALLDRAESRLALAEPLVEEGVLDRARVLVESVRDDHEAARGHALSVERADEFQFGPQRSVHERVERLGWEIEAVAAEPLRAATEAKLLARAADGARAKVEHWERAFRRFGRVLVLVEDDPEPAFAGSPAEVRGELSNAAGRLVAIHRTLARVEWDAAVGRAAADAPAAPTEGLDAAVAHAERAHDLTDRFQPGGAAGLAELLAEMRSARDRTRATGEAAHLAETDELAATSAPATDGGTEDERRRSDGRQRGLVAGSDGNGSDPDPDARPG